MVVVFLVGVGIFLWLTFFSGLFAQDDALKVPNLLGEKIEDVTQDQEILQHFKIVEQAREPSEDYPEGQIIRQDPGRRHRGDCRGGTHHHSGGGQLREGDGGDD